MPLTCNKQHIKSSHPHTHMDINRDVDCCVSNWQTSKPKALDETRSNKNIFHSAKLLKKRD